MTYSPEHFDTIDAEREQRWQDEQDWIAGQDAKRDYLVLCSDMMVQDDIHALLSMGFDVVSLLNTKHMTASEPLLATCIQGEAMRYIATNAKDDLVLFSMSETSSIQYFIRN